MIILDTIPAFCGQTDRIDKSILRSAFSACRCMITKCFCIICVTVQRSHLYPNHNQFSSLKFVTNSTFRKVFTRTTRSIARYLLGQSGWMAGWVAGCHTPVLCLNLVLSKNFFDLLVAPSFHRCKKTFQKKIKKTLKNVKKT